MLFYALVGRYASRVTTGKPEARTPDRNIHIDRRQGLGAAGWGYRNLYGAAATRPAPPLTHKNQGSNGGLTPKICKQAETHTVSAIFLSKGR